MKSRDDQFEALRSELTALTERMAEMESVNKQAEGLLQEEVRRKEEVLQAKHLYQLVDQVLSNPVGSSTCALVATRIEPERHEEDS